MNFLLGNSPVTSQPHHVLNSIEFPYANGLKFVGASYNLQARDSRLASSGYAILTTQADPKTGLVETTIGKFSELPHGLGAGQVDVLLPARQFIGFQKGTFKQLAASNTGGASTFTAFLADAANNRTGSLKINLSTNDVRLFGTDGSVEKLGTLPLSNGETQLQVLISKSGGTLVNVLDAANASVKGS